MYAWIEFFEASATGPGQAWEIEFWIEWVKVATPCFQSRRISALFGLIDRVGGVDRIECTVDLRVIQLSVCSSSPGIREGSYPVIGLFDPGGGPGRRGVARVGAAEGSRSNE
ncbi:hypothetical protein [Nocardia sp. XZ_19_369]|uniref:hypothetical protein n=1 Tax=Nocardia sp. XZ_19_369 TaxID=2769487 RepID=UPI00189014CC|nr:hypothetical protein [Nocardia sp. XZ_19_369]